MRLTSRRRRWIWSTGEGQGCRLLGEAGSCSRELLATSNRLGVVRRSLGPCLPVHWNSMTGNLFENEASGGTAGVSGWYTAHCDGGSRGNPGPAGYGAVIEDPEGKVVARLSEFLGTADQQLRRIQGTAGGAGVGTRERRAAAACRLGLRTDGAADEGQYKVKNPGLRPLWEEAQRLARRLEDLRCGTRCAAGTKKRTGWRMRRWMKEWADRQSEFRGFL